MFLTSLLLSFQPEFGHHILVAQTCSCFISLHQIGIPEALAGTVSLLTHTETYLLRYETCHETYPCWDMRCILAETCIPAETWDISLLRHEMYPCWDMRRIPAETWDVSLLRHEMYPCWDMRRIPAETRCIPAETWDILAETYPCWDMRRIPAETHPCWDMSHIPTETWDISLLRHETYPCWDMRHMPAEAWDVSLLRHETYRETWNNCPCWDCPCWDYPCWDTRYALAERWDRAFLKYSTGPC